MRTLIILLFCFSAYSTYGQFSYGVRGGIQLVTLDCNRASNDFENKKVSYHGGVFIEYRINNKMSIVGDIVYSDKGYVFNSNYMRYQKDQFIYHLKYASLPIMIQYNFSNHFGVLGGVEFGVLLSSYSRLDGGSKESEMSYYGNPIDWGLGGGLIYQVNSRFNVMLRYIQGLSNVLAKNAFEKYGTYDNPTPRNLRDIGTKYHNQTLQLSIGYVIHKCKQRER